MSSAVALKFCHPSRTGRFPLSGVGSNPFSSNASRACVVHFGFQVASALRSLAGGVSELCGEPDGVAAFELSPAPEFCRNIVAYSFFLPAIAIADLKTENSPPLGGGFFV